MDLIQDSMEKAQDKTIGAIDRSNNHMYLTWTQFDNYGSSSPDSSYLSFFKISDAGKAGLHQNELVRQRVILDQGLRSRVLSPASRLMVKSMCWAGPKGIGVQ